MKCQIWVFGFYLTFVRLWKLLEDVQVCWGGSLKQNQLRQIISSCPGLAGFAKCKINVTASVRTTKYPKQWNCEGCIYLHNRSAQNSEIRKFTSTRVDRVRCAGSEWIKRQAVCKRHDHDRRRLPCTWFKLCATGWFNAMVRPAVPGRQPWFANTCQVTPASLLCLFLFICHALPWQTALPSRYLEMYWLSYTVSEAKQMFWWDETMWCLSMQWLPCAW